MTNQEKKAYLNQYRALGISIEQKYEEIQRLRSLVEKVTPTLSDMPKKGGTNDRMPEYIERIIRLENELDDCIDRYVDQRAAIVRAINTVGDMTLRTLLEYRYLGGKTWENVAEKMYYSRMQISRLHKKAIDAVVL